jgi:Tol biopolymer transport system component
MKRVLLSFVAGVFITCGVAGAKRPDVDLSIVSVPEESGAIFERITEEADCVFSRYLVRKGSNPLKSQSEQKLDWWINPQIAISPDGQQIAYITDRNNTSNVMIKNLHDGGSGTQRTFRSCIEDISWSSDGSTICFTEFRNKHHGVYLVNAYQGNVVQQISNSSENEFAGVISADNNTIFLHRSEGQSEYGIWGYDRTTNLFSNYTRGMSPCLDPRNPDTIYCVRYMGKHESEILRINFKTGKEEIILSQPGHSFTTPQLSPDGRWILVTGVSGNNQQPNTDIFIVRTDGSQFTQLTYHPGNDLSAIWAPTGESIYFLSQRGSTDGIYNVWKMSFNK